MNRASGFRILAMAFLAAGTMEVSNRVWAQAPAGQVPVWNSPQLRCSSDTNQLHIVADRSLPPAYGPAAEVRFVQVQNTEPAHAEPIGPGAPQGNGSASPPSAPIPVPTASGQPGNYEEVDTGWKPIEAVTASIAPPPGELPANLAAPRFAQAGVMVAPFNANHDWPTLSYSWEASATCHNPLYFEDVNLERYGYSHGILQPLISGGRFFTTVVFLPYKIVAHPPGEIIYPLGYYRPGDAAPPVRQIEPIKLSASAVEAAFIVGMIVLLP